MGNSYSMAEHIPQVEKPFGVFDANSAMLDQGFGPCLYHKTLQSKGFKLQGIPPSGETNMAQIVLNACAKHGGANAMGFRKLLKTHMVAETPGGKEFEKLELENVYNWLSYNDLKVRVLSVATGMKHFFGLPDGAYDKHEKIVIFAETQMDWMVTTFASWCLGLPIVTVYATLGAEGAAYAIDQTEAKYIVADSKLLKVLSKVVNTCPSVTHIMTLGSGVDAKLKESVSNGGKVKVEEIEKIKELGLNKASGGNLNDIAKDGLATPTSNYAVYMYTSGTTGNPKGVLITHANLCACLATCQRVISPIESVKTVLKEQPVYMAYLPLAHIMEIVAELTLVYLGAALAYGSPHTLTETGVKLKRPESEADSFLARPHLFVMAPAVLDKVYNNASKKIAAQSGFKKWVAQSALDSGSDRFDSGEIGSSSLWNSLTFKKTLQTAVGGRCIAVASGSAPLSKDVQKFCQTTLCAPIRQGYGLTETCAVSCFAEWCDNTPCQVGAPTVTSCVRLADWADGGYQWKDKDDPAIGMPRGEVLIGGPMVSAKYFTGMPGKPQDPELEKKNAEDYITLQGIRFFRSGDIGQITKDGVLQIIDRKKDLWKGPNGEYVALSKVEGILKLHPVIEIPMVYGKTGGEWPVAVICADKGNLGKFATEECGLSADTPFETLISSADVNAKLLASIKKLCSAQKLVAFEMPQKICFSKELWTPENELLTAAMKLKRPQIVAYCKADIDKLYGA